MNKKFMGTKENIINHLLKNGKKALSEKILLNSFKELQKTSTKKISDLVKLAIFFTTPTFKLHKLANKRVKRKKNQRVTEIPSFILEAKSRVSFSIKLILFVVKTKKSKDSYIKLKNEFLLNAAKQGEAIQIKKEIQKQVLIKKHFLNYFKYV